MQIVLSGRRGLNEKKLHSGYQSFNNNVLEHILQYIFNK